MNALVAAGTDEPNRRPRLKLLPHPGYELVLAEVQKGRSVEATCRRLRAKGWHVPSVSRFVEWAHSNAERYEEYARAKRISMDVQLDAIDAMLDSALVDDNGQPITDPAVLSARVNIAKEKANKRQWFASKIAPKLYGDKLNVEHSGNLSVTVATGIPDLSSIPLASPKSVLSYELGADDSGEGVQVAQASSSTPGSNPDLGDCPGLID